MWMASFDPFLPERRDVLPSMAISSAGVLISAATQATKQRRKAWASSVAKMSPKWSWLGVPSAKGRKRRSNPNFLSQKHAMSVKPSAPARTASNDKSRISSKG